MMFVVWFLSRPYTYVIVEFGSFAFTYGENNFIVFKELC